MIQPTRPSMRQFKGQPPGVSVADKSDNEADVVATQLLIEANTKNGVFICPRCKAKIADMKEAINHLADEINKSMAALPSVLAAGEKETK